MNINTVFPSLYLKAEELEGDTTVTIREVTIEEIGTGKDADKKPVLHFKELEKGLACNKTNCKTIGKLYGDETDHWIGKRITLFATEVDFQGDQVLAIRVRMRAPVGASTNAGSAGVPEADPDTEGAKRKAWDAYKAKYPSFPADELAEAWRYLLKSYNPNKAATAFTAADWQAVKARIEKPESPISAEPEFKEDDIPF